MRKFLFRLGWAILILAPVAYIAQIVHMQDIPPIEPWKWAIVFGAVALVYLSRNTDDVLKHHLIS